jgi:hypothetical protein
MSNGWVPSYEPPASPNSYCCTLGDAFSGISPAQLNPGVDISPSVLTIPESCAITHLLGIWFSVVCLNAPSTSGNYWLSVRAFSSDVPISDQIDCHLEIGSSRASFPSFICSDHLLGDKENIEALKFCYWTKSPCWFANRLPMDRCVDSSAGQGEEGTQPL